MSFFAVFLSQERQIKETSRAKSFSVVIRRSGVAVELLFERHYVELQLVYMS